MWSPAFAASVALGRSKLHSGRESIYSSFKCAQVLRKPRSSKPLPSRTFVMTANFDDIAKQLQQELKRRAVDPSDPGLPPMPPTDAPPEHQPIEITHGNNDLPKVILRHAPSSQEAQIYCYGAAVTSWTTRGEEHFWVSDQNKWQLGGKAIRGGIPICFPQFGPYGDLVQHGFARVSDWRIRNTTVNEDQSVTAVFGLSSESGQEAMAAWPHKFDAEYSVTLSIAGLETMLSVKNTDTKPFSFTCAFHNYFKTSAAGDARVFGFENLKHLNRLDGDKEMAEQEDTGAGVMLTEETDRIYMNAPEELAIFDFATLKVLKIKKTQTLQDATLWNPFGAEGADPGWNNFICIEPACITKPATLQPGETWVGAQLLGVE